MPISDEDAMRLVARVALLHNIAGLMFREMAIGTGKSADDVARFAEASRSARRSAINSPARSRWREMRPRAGHALAVAG